MRVVVRSPGHIRSARSTMVPGGSSLTEDEHQARGFAIRIHRECDLPRPLYGRRPPRLLHSLVSQVFWLIEFVRDSGEDS